MMRTNMITAAMHVRRSMTTKTMAMASSSSIDRHSTVVPSLRGRSLLSIEDLSRSELEQLLACSAKLKALYKGGYEGRPLGGKTMAMIFQKRSTRTRVSAETGIQMLGGHGLFLGPQDVHIGVNESLYDTSKVLSGFNSMIMARVFGHADVSTLAREASVPVLNALSDLHHPLQTLADLLTLSERYGGLENLRGRSVAWVGDGNNIIHDLGLGCAKLGIHVKLACPAGYEPDHDVFETTKRLAKIEGGGSQVSITTNPLEAVDGAMAVVTDTWVSMGQEEENEKRIKDFDGYQVDTNMMQHAASDGCFMHCLPRHEEEVTDEVFYSDKSLVFPAAENRMWTVMAVINSMLAP